MSDPRAELREGEDYWRCPHCGKLNFAGHPADGCIHCGKRDLRAELRELCKRLRASRAHTYASENADHYRGFDAGQLRAAESIEAILSRHGEQAAALVESFRVTFTTTDCQSAASLIGCLKQAGFKIDKPAEAAGESVPKGGGE